MRLAIGLFLTLIGAALMRTGLGLALLALISLYKGVLDDPMGDNTGTAEPSDIARQGICRGVIIAALGIPPFLVGMVMVKGANAQKIAWAAPALRQARTDDGRADKDRRPRNESGMLDPARYQVLTFDCYGTLIDWERGILAALGGLIAHHRVEPPDEELLAMYAALEPAAQAGEYRTYREVLADVTRALARELGMTLRPGEERTLADSVGDWPAFRDTPKALARLAEHYDLAILSNIDRDLFEQTRPRLLGEHGFDFTAVITAEDTRSYKPAIGHFWRAIETLGVPGARILHVAQSLYHDVVPAQSMGISTVWVNRREGHEGSGATPFTESERDAEPDLVVPDLRTLADHLVG